MDNNPFRNQQPVAGNTFGQQQQQQQAPYQTMSYTGYQQPYSQQLQPYSQPQQPQQQYSQLQQQPYSQLQSSYNLQQYSQPQQPYQTQGTSTTTTPTFNSAYNTTSYPQQNSSLYSTSATTPYSPYSNTITPGYSIQGMPTPASYSSTMGYPYGQNNASNFYIPSNFGQTTNNTPRHAPVDASSLLKGTEIRRVECPVCKKMLEGDDMAINHHVNDHYS